MNSNQWIYNKYAHGCGKVLLPIKARASSQNRLHLPLTFLGLLILSAALLYLFISQGIDTTSSSLKDKESGKTQRIIMDILGSPSEAPQAPVEPRPKKQLQQEASVQKKAPKPAPAEPLKKKPVEMKKAPVSSPKVGETKKLDSRPKTAPFIVQQKSIPERGTIEEPSLQTGSLDIGKKQNTPRPRATSAIVETPPARSHNRESVSSLGELGAESSSAGRPKVASSPNAVLKKQASVDSDVLDTGQSNFSSAATSPRRKPGANVVGIERRTKKHRESSVQTGTMSTGNAEVGKNPLGPTHKLDGKSISRRMDDTEALESIHRLPVGNAPPARKAAPRHSSGPSSILPNRAGGSHEGYVTAGRKNDFSSAPSKNKDYPGNKRISKPQTRPQSLSEINSVLRSSAALNLGELPICSDLAQQDRLQDRVVRILRPYRDKMSYFCKDKTGTYGFWNIRSGNTLAVKYAPTDGTQPGNRCSVLKQAIKCLQQRMR